MASPQWSPIDELDNYNLEPKAWAQTQLSSKLCWMKEIFNEIIKIIMDHLNKKTDC